MLSGDIGRAPERVLATMDELGHRIRLRPRPSPGRFHRARGVVAASLIALFVALPYLPVGGRPAILLDLVHREFSFFGRTFRPTDGVLLMMLGLTVVLAVFLITALIGRGWCGWACPQTVYLEWLYRPIERLWEGGPAGQRRLDAGPRWHWRRLGKLATFALLSVVVANVFLGYFVGVDQLARWVRQSPFEHPVGFLVMASVGALMFADFAWFREQTCMVACPYGRLQSVLLDRQSLIVGYDAARGEPRGKKGSAGAGDCVDCKACVTTCPTGIDIREGLQMECIACAQCVDACDAIMGRLGRAPGLIRYSSQDELAGKPRKLLRPRLFVYPVLLAIALGGFLYLLLAPQPTAEVFLLRGEGAPFSRLPDGRVSTPVRLKIENRSGADHRYRIELVDAGDAELIVPLAELPVKAGQATVAPAFVLSPARAFDHGERRVGLRVLDEQGLVASPVATLLGPEQ
ncbi:MAG TPA: cytochrome c oxidase accessory protein CcoG, partial [Kofleriaceae bacterium]|nr:cytochrome c oxidase accessory protein CcoG [Kofleriaceae bacterium]